MKTNISRTLLASVGALAVTLSLPAIQAFTPDHFSSAAFARGGSDDGDGGGGSGSSGGGNSGSGRSGGSDDSGGGGRGGDDHGGGGRGGDDNGGRGGHDDGDDDHGGRGGHDDGDDDHSGRGGHDDDDDDRGRGRDDGAENDRDEDEPGQHRGDRRDDNRPEVTLSVSEASLAGLLNGSLAAVDQLGRRLEVEVELEHGTRSVVAHPHRGDFARNPGGITSVNIVPASR